MDSNRIDLIECPRDAMQGIHPFIPTEKKVRYIQSLLSVGFHTLDCGSFVSEKAIPQMRDTQAVLDQLDLSNTQTKLLTIVANYRGAKQAASFSQVDYLGYPFSVSETFQLRNTNKTIKESQALVEDLVELADKHNKELVVYISMGFGNPYREPWSAEMVEDFAEALINRGVRILSLSDTIGTSNPENIDHLFSKLIVDFPQATFGAHLHTTPDSWAEKVEAAWQAGCRRFDGAIKGFGGCPMAKDDLVGNMPMEKLISFAQKEKLDHGLNLLDFESAYNKALETFPV